MPDYRLYCTGVSGNCYKVALMLSLSKCSWEPVAVDYMGGETRAEKFRSELNELGEIPVLEHGAKRLTQSGAILTYLARRTGRFEGRNEDERLDVLRWILFDNHKFTSYFATLRFLVGIQKGGETPVTEFLRGRAQTAFGLVERHLATQPLLVGEAPTIADLSLAGYVYYPEETGLSWSSYPNIEAWKKRIAALPGWAGPYELMAPKPPA
jgi:glutathione S-transferase